MIVAFLRSILAGLPWAAIAFGCLTIGLAPFSPEPHLVEKLRMLAHGTLRKPIDIFDLLMHAAPFFAGALKLVLGDEPAGVGTHGRSD